MAYKCGDLRIDPNEDYLIRIDEYPDNYRIGTRKDLENLKADIEAMLKE